MEFSVLGPLEVRADGRAVSLGGAKPRGVLAFLLLHAGEPVSADRLAPRAVGRLAGLAAIESVDGDLDRAAICIRPTSPLGTARAGHACGPDRPT